MRKLKKLMSRRLTFKQLTFPISKWPISCISYLRFLTEQGNYVNWTWLERLEETFIHRFGK